MKGATRLVLNSFGARHWDVSAETSVKIRDVSQEQFMDRVRAFVDEKGGFDKCSVEGYAPFCRHVFIPNFTDAKVDCVEITPAIEGKIKSGYKARRAGELAVLTRWIAPEDLPSGVPKADFLDLIFYSYDQIKMETESFDKEGLGEAFDWGLISIKAQVVGHETPMMPMTAMRNALGAEYGGSSDPINPQKYQESVDFWERHVSIAS